MFQEKQARSVWDLYNTVLCHRVYFIRSVKLLLIMASKTQVRSHKNLLTLMPQCISKCQGFYVTLIEEFDLFGIHVNSFAVIMKIKEREDIII